MGNSFIAYLRTPFGNSDPARNAHSHNILFPLAPLVLVLLLSMFGPFHNVPNRGEFPPPMSKGRPDVVVLLLNCRTRYARR